MTTTVYAEQNRWQYLDARLLTAAGVPINNVTDPNASVYINYKKYGDDNWTIKLSEQIDGALDGATLLAATSLLLEDTSSFPSEDFIITLDPGGADEEHVRVLTNNTTVNVFTLATAMTIAQADAAVVRLRDWLNLFTPLIPGGSANPPGGYYSILFNPTELSELGQFVYTVIDQGHAPPPADFERTIEVIASHFIDSESAPSLATCILKDHILTPAGVPVQNVSVSARLLALPSNVSGVGLQDIPISASTDSNGFFQLTLIQGATVDITIPSIGYRRTILVPSSTLANLFEVS